MNYDTIHASNFIFYTYESGTNSFPVCILSLTTFFEDSAKWPETSDSLSHLNISEVEIHHEFQIASQWNSAKLEIRISALCKLAFTALVDE